MYAKIINEQTKQCDVGIGTNIAFYQKLGMEEMEVEQAYNGAWYVAGYAPEEPEAEARGGKEQGIKEPGMKSGGRVCGRRGFQPWYPLGFFCWKR